MKTREGTGKRGQVTLFIILGVAVVIVAGLIVFFFTGDTAPSSRISTTQIEPIKVSFEECVTEKLEEELKDRKKFGGRENLDFPSGSPFNSFNVLNSPFNNLPPLNIIEESISQNIEERILAEECSLEDFRNDFEITENENGLNADITISPNSVNLQLDYPIIVEKGEFKGEIEKFNIVYEDNFGEMVLKAKEIINGEVGGTEANIVEYCLNSQNIKCYSPDSINGFKVIQIEDIEGATEEGEIMIFTLKI